MFVCLCEGVTDRAIRAAIAAGAGTVEEIGDECGAGTVCGGCVHYVEEMLDAAIAAADETGSGGAGVA